MSENNHTVNFKLDPETFAKLSSSKNLTLDVKHDDLMELILSDVRIKLDVNKKKSPTATYYNNKSSSLYYLGDSVSANATTKVLTDTDKKRIKSKEREKTTTRGVELLDIPSMPTTISPSSPIPPKQAMKSTLKKPSTGTSTSNNNSKNNTKKTKSTNNNNNSNNNIPTSRGSSTPQTNTPKPSTYIPVEKLNDRIIQLLALKPYQVTTMAKIVESTQWEVKKIMDEVGIQLPDQSQKKKYCLKPTLYKNIRIWDWPLYSNEEKIIVCDNAKEAYDILHLPSDAIERNNLIDPTTQHKLIQPPPGKVPITTERDRAIAAKKSSNNNNIIKKKVIEKKHLPDIKGKGKTTPSSGFLYSANTTEPIAPTPSIPITTTTKVKPIITQRSSTSLNNNNSSSQHLKPSSSNKKVGSKGLPSPQPQPHTTNTTPSIGKSSPTTKSPIVTKNSPTATKSSSKLILPTKSSKLPSSTKAVKRKNTEAGVTHQPTSSKKIKSTDYSHHHSPVELSELSTQPLFDSYCAKYINEQKAYQNTKLQFKQKYPNYIKVLESTHPPTGSKRSYFDLKLEYYDLVKENYLKKGDQSSWEEAESHLRDCNAKRRRLNFMWNSIEKSLNDHHYKLNRKM